MELKKLLLVDKNSNVLISYEEGSDEIVVNNTIKLEMQDGVMMGIIDTELDGNVFTDGERFYEAE